MNSIRCSINWTNSNIWQRIRRNYKFISEWRRNDLNVFPTNHFLGNLTHLKATQRLQFACTNNICSTYLMICRIFFSRNTCINNFFNTDSWRLYSIWLIRTWIAKNSCCWFTVICSIALRMCLCDQDKSFHAR